MRNRIYYLLVPCIFYSSAICQKSVVDSLHQIIALGKLDREHAKAMNTLAGEYLRSDIEKAKALLHQTVILGKNLNDTRALSASYSQLVTINQNSGKQDSALHYLSLLKKIAIEPVGPDADIIQLNYNSTAGLYHKKTGNPKQALQFFKQAVFFVEKTKNKVSTAGQMLNLGNTYLDLGDYKKALENHLKALKIFEEVGNKRGESFCYQSIANSLAELRQYEDALKYAKKSINLKTELNDKRGIGTAEDGLGNIYMGIGRYDRAIQHFRESLEIATELNLVTEQSKVLFNIGKAYAAKNNKKEAIDNFQKSKQLAKQVGDNATSSAVDIELLALQKSSPSESENKIVSSLKTFTSSGDRIKEAAGYKNAADFYTAKKQYDKALEYTNKYYRLNDRIGNNELKMQLKKMQEQYNIDQKEKEIAILKKDQQLNAAKLQRQQTFQIAAIIFLALLVLIAFLIINRYRALNRAKRLIELEKMRNDIAKDLHDDIGSTLTSINILSNMMLVQPDGKGIESSGLKKIKEHSSTIMENMSDIVWAINPQNDTVERMIVRMKEFASEILDPLNITYSFIEKGNFSEMKLDPKKRKDLYLISKEAINNAAKYSRCKHVKIILENDGRSLHLQVTDDGDGFDALQVKKGNGLKNIQQRSSDMSGMLNYRTAVGRGTSVELDVPIT